jgi:hypothetical protein
MGFSKKREIAGMGRGGIFIIYWLIEKNEVLVGG